MVTMVNVGQYVKITSYAGPLVGGEFEGKLVKVVAKDDKHVVTDHVHIGPRGAWDRRVLILAHNEYEAIPVDVKDSKGREIRVGDEIAWAVYAGGLNIGVVSEIVPTVKKNGRHQYIDGRYKWVAEPDTIAYSLRVEMASSSYWINADQEFTRETQREVSAPRTVKRRVADMSRVVVVSPLPVPVDPRKFLSIVNS